MLPGITPHQPFAVADSGPVLQQKEPVQVVFLVKQTASMACCEVVPLALG
jgi:hypothetical protein